MQAAETHRLSTYATNYHRWRTDSQNDRVVFKRPLGLVESFFSYDGSDQKGRADVTFALSFNRLGEFTAPACATDVEVDRTKPWYG